MKYSEEEIKKAQRDLLLHTLEMTKKRVKKANKKGVLKEMAKSILKKFVAFTHTVSAHFIHIPVKWCKEMDIEKDKQVLLEFDGEKITIKKIK